jgi:hypothetical protein
MVSDRWEQKPQSQFQSFDNGCRHVRLGQVPTYVRSEASRPDGVEQEGNFGMVCREISRGLADQPSVKKKRPIPNFLTPAVPLARGGGGDRRRLAGLTSFRERV